MSKSAGLTAPATGRIRAYFAESGTIFDPALLAGFNVDAPGAAWTDLGWCAAFTRRCGTKVEPLVTGAPGFATGQVRTEVEAEVSLEFESWGKVQMALSCGAQQMNVLAPVTNASAAGSGGFAAAAAGLTEASSSSFSLNVGSAVSGFSVGDRVAVDVDYSGQTGAVGAGVAGGFVRAGAAIADVDYVRRITLNVACISAISGTVLTLKAPLLGGVPTAAMKVSKVVGLCDREGATFFQEWAGLFVAEGMQGDRIAWFYPRLQTTTGATETRQELDGALGTLRLAGKWRALPVVDGCDGERVVCFRTYVAG